MRSHFVNHKRVNVMVLDGGFVSTSHLNDERKEILTKYFAVLRVQICEEQQQL